MMKDTWKVSQQKGITFFAVSFCIRTNIQPKFSWCDVEAVWLQHFPQDWPFPVGIVAVSEVMNHLLLAGNWPGIEVEKDTAWKGTGPGRDKEWPRTPL